MLARRYRLIVSALTLAAVASVSIAGAARSDLWMDESSQAGVPPGSTGTAETARPAAGGAKEVRRGFASIISDTLNGRTTASGESYDKTTLVAAHATYAMGTVVRVTNEQNGRSVEVKIVDRGPVRAGRRRPIIDLSHAAAERLDFVTRGTARVRTEVVEWGTGRGGAER
jgi:peptidoglycan lytic transglycosylase